MRSRIGQKAGRDDFSFVFKDRFFNQDKITRHDLIIFSHLEGLMQDSNLGGNMNVSSCWSITNIKKYCRQIGLLCSVLCLVQTNILL